MPEPRESVVAYIGLGSNLGDSITTITTAFRELSLLSKAIPARCASLYRSAPVGVGEQPDFINSVCEITTALDAEDLLGHLMKIERKFGRERSDVTGEARTLDLDLLLYGISIIQSATLTVPHPRLHERAFVLYPLVELAPNLLLPEKGKIVDLLGQCADQQIERIVE